MAHKERSITILGQYDPDLVKLVQKARKEHTDATTGEVIPKGSAYYLLPLRAGRNLVNAHVTVENYQKLQEEQA